jgi:hypothetical protein
VACARLDRDRSTGSSAGSRGEGSTAGLGVGSDPGTGSETGSISMMRRGFPISIEV